MISLEKEKNEYSTADRFHGLTPDRKLKMRRWTWVEWFALVLGVLLTIVVAYYCAG